MLIKPFFSIKDSPIASFPSLKMFFHEDDLIPGAANGVVTWKCRVTGVTVTFTPDTGFSILKDEDGVYCDGTSTRTVSGTMPTILATHYAVAMAIGKTSDASSVNGASVVFGADGATNPTLNSAGVARYNSANLNTAPALSPAALTTAGRPVCQLTYFDFVDTTSPRIERVTCNTNFSDANSMTFGAGTTTGLGAITPGAMAAGMSWGSINGGTVGARQRAAALFLFTTPVTFEELKIACMNSALTGELPAMWRNKL